MKALLFLLSALFITTHLSGQTVVFRDLSWEQVNLEASKENKFIFVDAYTKWCGWCKVMDKKLLKKEEVCNLLNDKFIAVKIDFEDSTGLTLAKKFRVWSFPTTLVFNPQGKLVGKFSGYTEDTKRYIDFLSDAISNKDERIYDGFDSRDLDLEYPEIYLKCFDVNNREWPSDSAVLAFLEGKDLFSEINWSVYARFMPVKYEDFVFQNAKELRYRFGDEEVNDIMLSGIERHLQAAIKSNSNEELDQLSVLCSYTSNPELTRGQVLTEYHLQKAQWDKAIANLEGVILTSGFVNAMYINNTCWKMYEECNDKSVLIRAKDLMKKVNEISSQYDYTDTYAALLYKTGNYKEALVQINKAIEFAKSEGISNYSSSTDLKKKIEAQIP